MTLNDVEDRLTRLGQAEKDRQRQNSEVERRANKTGQNPTFSRNQGQSDEQPSGLRRGLAARPSAASRQFESRLNAWARHSSHVEAPAGVRIEEIARNDLPDAMAGALSAFERTTRTTVHVIRNLTPEVQDFNALRDLKLQDREDIVLIDAGRDSKSSGSKS